MDVSESRGHRRFDSEHMGSLCSKSSNHEGDHVVLTNPTNETNVGGRQAPPDRRQAAAEAAERRLREVSYYLGFPLSSDISQWHFQTQRKGVHDANPKRGQLAQQLAKQNSNRGAAEPQLPERLIVRLFSIIVSCTAKSFCSTININIILVAK